MVGQIETDSRTEAAPHRGGLESTAGECGEQLVAPGHPLPCHNSAVRRRACETFWRVEERSDCLVGQARIGCQIPLLVARVQLSRRWCGGSSDRLDCSYIPTGRMRKAIRWPIGSASPRHDGGDDALQRDPLICFCCFRWGKIRTRTMQNMVERFFNKIKQCRRIAARCDKLEPTTTPSSSSHLSRLVAHL